MLQNFLAVVVEKEQKRPPKPSSRRSPATCTLKLPQTAIAHLTPDHKQLFVSSRIVCRLQPLPP